jgi:hypothetical protein
MLRQKSPYCYLVRSIVLCSVGIFDSYNFLICKVAFPGEAIDLYDRYTSWLIGSGIQKKLLIAVADGSNPWT